METRFRAVRKKTFNRKLKELNKGYYLDHFKIVFNHCQKFYPNCNELKKIELLFSELNEIQQRLIVKLSTYKASFYKLKNIVRFMNEQDVDAWNSLQDLGILKAVKSQDLADIVPELKKDEAVAILSTISQNHKKSWKVAKLRLHLLSCLEILPNIEMADLSILKQYYKLNCEADIKFLKYLYFGDVEKGLNLFALKDLGLRKSSGVFQQECARFNDIEIAKEIFECDLIINDSFYVSEKNSSKIKQLINKAPQNDLHELKQNQLIEKLANFYLSAGNDERALLLLKKSTMFPALKLRFKLLEKSNDSNLEKLLKHSLENPKSQEQYHFALTMLDKNFSSTSLIDRSRQLFSPKVIEVDESFYKSPEKGARDYYQAQGYKVRRYENYIWRAMFGLFFWEKLFETQNLGVSNPFDSFPISLKKRSFFKDTNKWFESEWSKLTKAQLKSKMVKVSVENFGKRNPFVKWPAYLLERIAELIDCSSLQSLKEILKTMSKDYMFYNDGFPDLALFRDGKVKLIEVKGPGDVLRPNQIRQIKLLKKAGFDVKVANLKYTYNPDLIYSVVDVETTGGKAQHHRITEIGIVKIQNGIEIDRYQTLINPLRRIPYSITKLTGITDQMVSVAPTFEQVSNEIIEFLRGTIFTAHNVNFDYSFVRQEFNRIGIRLSRPTFCTCANMRKYFKGLKSYSLANLTTHFEIKLDQHHRALCDAVAAAQLLKLINDKRS